MDLRRIIPSDITASAIAHLSLLTLMLLFSDVHPFGAVTAEQIPVEIVTPQEIAEKQASCRAACRREQAANRFQRQRRSRISPLLDKPAAASAPPPSAQPPTPRRRRSRLPWPLRLRPSRQPRLRRNPPAAAPAYKPPEPDLSIKYQVLLGLPPESVANRRRLRRRVATRPTTISTRRRPRRPISPAIWSRNFGGTSRPARNCRRR